MIDSARARAATTARAPAWIGTALLASVVFVVAMTVAVGGLDTTHHSGDVGYYHTIAARLRGGLVPYQSGFYLEYPPFSLPAFAIPSYVSDAHYLEAFKALMTLCGVGLVFVTTRLLALAGLSRARTLGALGILALAPVLQGHTFVNRYDLWPALLTSVALLLCVTGRERSAAVFLALSFATKTYALALAPLFAIWILQRYDRRRLVEAVGAFVATCVVVFGPFLVLAPGGVANSYLTQLRRGLQIESTGASFLLVADKLGLYRTHWVRGLAIDLHGSLPTAVGALSTVVEIAAILAVAWLYARGGRRDSATFLTACAAAILAFVALGKVLSPQYMVWLVALVPLVARRLLREAVALTAVALVCTQVVNTWGDWGLRNVDWTVWFVFARNLALLALLALLGRALLQRSEST